MRRCFQEGDSFFGRFGGNWEGHFVGRISSRDGENLDEIEGCVVVGCEELVGGWPLLAPAVDQIYLSLRPISLSQS